MRQSVLLAALARVIPARPKPAVDPELRQHAAHRFCDLMDEARRHAIANGVRPVPPAVSRALLGYFPSTLLQKCRYRTDPCRPLYLPVAPFSYGDLAAMTFGDVVLFRNEQVALTDLQVWAHQLTHVMQCQRWGMDGFAEHYLHDPESIEREATENAERFSVWFAANGAAQGQGGGRPPLPGSPG